MAFFDIDAIHHHRLDIFILKCRSIDVGVVLER